MPDSAPVKPADHRPSRRTLVLLVIPIVGLIVLSNIGNALSTTWFDTHPLALLALNSQNRNLILTTNYLDPWSYYLMGTARLLVADPLFFLLGLWYGDAALQWLERRTKTLGETVRQMEGVFRRFTYPVVFLFPNQYVCMFAGAAGMSVPGFFVTNLAGTVARLYLIRRLGDTFESPIDSFRDFVVDYRGPLFVISLVLAAAFLVSELRGWRGGLGDLEDLAEQAEGGTDADVDRSGPTEG